ncbi:glycosyltransferase family 2 protein [Pedobacter puniceum]|uniref:Glycosyltransferase n=1 Tax=Pedobacter puniceum TaxID=2666136 RepID=A0A7K0FIC4_9SPHI|nr:glycosyltransferase [Pedobacter puniceum]MRX45683.1 glycosyltransferase [Pedobacter puniceum]
MPKVSVIIPTYNRSSYLKEAIESILSQSFKDFEIIITDNASTDNTEEIVKNFTDKRIKYFQNQENLGVVENHNIALRHCCGEYIHIFSDDDIMLPDCLSKKIEIINNNDDISLIHSDISIINSDGLIVNKEHWNKNRYKKKKIRDKILRNGITMKKYNFQCLFYMWNFISMPTVLVKKSLLFENGLFNQDTIYFCDWALWLKLAKNYNFYYLDSKTVLYRTHPLNIIKKNNTQNELTELTVMKNDVISNEYFTNCLISKKQIEKFQNIKLTSLLEDIKYFLHLIIKYFE